MRPQAKDKDAPYKVLVREIPLHRAFDVPATDVDAWLRGMPMRDALGAPEGDPQAGHGHAELDLYADGNHVFATGTFQGEMQVACSRCVAAATIPIKEKLLVTFMPAHELPDENDASTEGEDGAEIRPEDVDTFPFDGEVVDLEPVFREQFVLAVPYAPLCREDCKGLCPQCGIDRNSATCACEPPIDPRLAALKGLKLPS